MDKGPGIAAHRRQGLTLMIGKAGTGKTAAMIEEIRSAVESRQGGRVLIVPEQYSHEAERELCRRCGDTMSLYAEVFSFSALARRVMADTGGLAADYLDKGGRLLCMALALSQVSGRLTVYAAAQRKAELQALLLGAIDELKAARLTPEQLYAAAESCPDGLGDKLRDLALIAEAYDAVAARGHADPSDKLDILAQRIAEGGMGEKTHVYVDGFIDFTCQEQEVLGALLKTGAELSVCLTMDGLDGDSEIFQLSRRAARRLIGCAQAAGVEYSVQLWDGDGGKDPALAYFTDNMFSYSAESYPGERGAVELWRAGSVSAECELAAAKAIELVRDGGCRWRDVALAVRGFDDYRETLTSVFRQYGVPLYVSRRSDMLQKPLPSLISGLYDIVAGGWDVDDLISYMGTGLTGLSGGQCDILKNYIYKWQLRGGAWERESDWRQHPDGYGGEYDESARERLNTINELRRRLAGPILGFQKDCAQGETALAQAAALSAYFQRIELPRQLEERSRLLAAQGRETLAQEYGQLWDIIVSALEQSAAILGELPMDGESFGKLFTLMLSQYDVGTIPVSLDAVSAGDFDRMRRRSIKNLIVLGASDQRLPRTETETGVFSDEERERLLTLDIDLRGAGDSELWREFSLIYNCLSLPSDRLIMCCPALSPEGEEQRPAFVYNRARALFGLEPRTADIAEARSSAPAPALTLAAQGLRGGGSRERAALDYFSRREPERCAGLKAASEMSRGRLSARAVEALYGRGLKISASRADKFAACKFAYFCQYGLRAKPYEPAGFTPPEIGVFMHFVLENTAREVRDLGGFAQVSDETLREITEKYLELYVHQELNDFQEKSQRFIYLFKRLGKDVHQVVADMAQELRSSDFTPIEFELDFAKATELPPVELGEGADSVALTGIADRVDGWLHQGRLYLRVVDYKTGKKSFSLSDLWYGMDMQMLMYLYVLGEDGALRYGRETVPAGVMYVPARNAMLSSPVRIDAETAARQRGETVRRSGLVLDDPALIEAWEHGDDKRYIPIKYRYNKPTEDSLASAERFGLLSRHIKRRLGEMAGELRRGSIAADPFFRSQQENACMNCDFYRACWFSDGDNGESCRFTPKLSPDKVWSKLKGGEENG